MEHHNSRSYLPALSGDCRDDGGVVGARTNTLLGPGITSLNTVVLGVVSTNRTDLHRKQPEHLVCLWVVFGSGLRIV